MAIGAVVITCLLTVLGFPGRGTLNARADEVGEPAIDGQLDDMIRFAQSLNGISGCGIVGDDEPADVVLDDRTLRPCPDRDPDGYFINGFDIVQTVLAYSRVSRKLFLGIRTVGHIGDTDGDGDPSTFCGAACERDCNVEDLPGIGITDRYQWRIVQGCDPASGVTGIVTVTRDSVRVFGLLATGVIKMAFAGPDLEVEINGVTLPPGFSLQAYAASSSDGLGDDFTPMRSCRAAVAFELEQDAQPALDGSGGTVLVRIHLHNPSAITAAVEVQDLLPPVLTFAGGVTGIGEPLVDGSTLLFPTFELPGDSTRTISFLAKCMDVMTMDVTNVAVARVMFAKLCERSGIETVLQDLHDIDCGTPTQPTTWGSIKARYR